MSSKHTHRRRFPIFSLIAILILVLAAVGALVLRDKLPAVSPEPTESSAAETSLPPETTVTPTTVPPTTVPPTTAPPVDLIETTASFTVTGDLLMHKPVFNSCWDAEQGDWIFDPIFTYVSPYIQAADYAVANLETTLCGPDNGYAYSGNPFFNCPDGIARSSLNAGFDMLLTANNHCYDTRSVGVRRTLEVLEQVGLESLGTQADAEAPDYKVIDVGGIRVGMTAYAYETPDDRPDLPSLNGNQCHPSSVGMINSFDYDQLDKFYSEIGDQFTAMKEEGAEAIIVYMHWGEEYHLNPTKFQVAIAQKLCDMGVDVIIGGHPHVVEPVDLLTSTEDENHRTLVIYSTGNFISNQRIKYMDLKTGHTEDGILFHFTLARYFDGSVEVLETSCTPTWVHMTGSPRSYRILPLDHSLQDKWQEDFQISDSTYAACVDSYNRTMDLVGEGLEKAQAWFDAFHQAKDEELNGPGCPTETEAEATE